MMRGNDYDGTLIAIEGIDGSGKSSIVEAVEQWSSETDVEVVTTREPTDLWTGEQVYRALGDEETPPLADFSLFIADRIKHVEERIVPALERGAIVVTDRYADSTRAYQTHRIAEQMGVEYHEARRWMESVFDPWNVEADVTIYVDIPVSVALERAAGEDKYERSDNLETARRAYQDMYDRCDPSVRIIDGTQSLSAVKHKALNTVKLEAQMLADDEESVEPQKTYAEAANEE